MFLISREAILNFSLEFVNSVLEWASVMLRLLIVFLSLLGLIGWDSKLLMTEFLVSLIVVMVMTERALDKLSVGGRHKA